MINQHEDVKGSVLMSKLALQALTRRLAILLDDIKKIHLSAISRLTKTG